MSCGATEVDNSIFLKGSRYVKVLIIKYWFHQKQNNLILSFQGTKMLIFSLLKIHGEHFFPRKYFPGIEFLIWTLYTYQSYLSRVTQTYPWQKYMFETEKNSLKITVTSLWVSRACHPRAKTLSPKHFWMYH